MFSKSTYHLLKQALAEDLGSGDVTSRLLIPAETKASAVILAKSAGIFCGAELAAFLFKHLDPKIRVKVLLRDGQVFKPGQTLITIQGRLHAILGAERTALNLLGRLSGVASLAREFVQKAEPHGVEIYDTRKTTPLWRELEKYAVRCGGGRNHRFGLFDEIFVKENHKVFSLMERLKKYPRKFVIEVRDFRELVQAMALKPRVVLFDNASPDDLRRAVKLARSLDPRVELEASGGITLKNVEAYAKTGIDRISIGALTHSVQTVDLSLLVQAKARGR